MIDHDEMESLAAGYALSALDPEDQKVFERHLATCPQCQQRAAGFIGVAGVLPLTVEPREPPPSLRNRIVASVGAERRRMGLANGAKRSGSADFWRLLLKPAAISVPLVMLIISVVGLSVWNVSLQRRVEFNETQLSRTFRAAAIMAQADQWWRFEGTEAAPDATGTLAYSSLDEEGYLMVWGLPVDQEHIYVAWTQKDQTRSRVGTMWGMDGGLFRLIPGDTDSLEAVGITRWPANASSDAAKVDVAILSLRE